MLFGLFMCPFVLCVMCPCVAVWLYGCAVVWLCLMRPCVLYGCMALCAVWLCDRVICAPVCCVALCAVWRCVIRVLPSLHALAGSAGSGKTVEVFRPSCVTFCAGERVGMRQRSRSSSE